MRQRFWLVAVSLACLTACAQPQTAPPKLDPRLVEEEREAQRELALADYLTQQARLDDVAGQVLRGATSLCPADAVLTAGVRFASVYSFDEVMRPAARALGQDDSVRLTSVALGSAADRAGLEIDDTLVQLDGEEVGTGPEAVERLLGQIDELRSAGDRTVPVTYRRGRAPRTVDLVLDRACGYPVRLVESGELNAWTDGEMIYVSSAMMRFATDDELAVIVAHELAHIAMDHIGARRKNQLLGALIGALGDIAVAATTGRNTGGYYSASGAEIGGAAYSQAFEREADYVGLYALANAGLSLEAAPIFWRRMGVAKQSRISYGTTHPSTAERAVLMRATIEEIERKKLAAVALSPEMKDAQPSLDRLVVSQVPQADAALDAAEREPPAPAAAEPSPRPKGEPASRRLAEFRVATPGFALGAWTGEMESFVGERILVWLQIMPGSGIGAEVGNARYSSPVGECSYSLHLRTVSLYRFSVTQQLIQSDVTVGRCEDLSYVELSEQGSNSVVADWYSPDSSPWLSTTLARSE